MANASKKSARNKSAPAVIEAEDAQPIEKAKKRSSVGRLARILYRPKLLLLLAMIVSGVVFAEQIQRWLPDLKQQPRYQLRAENVTITPPPRWVPVDIVEQVLQNAGLSNRATLLDDDLVAVLAKSFERHAWVEDVSGVRLRPDGISVELTYRTPIAMVQLKRGLYPVDIAGTVLPPEDFSPTDAKRFPVIQNVKSPPHGAIGTRWGEIGVTAAAQLAEVLAAHWKEFNLVAIHVPDMTSATTTVEQMAFTLLTEGGSQIVWGRAPGSHHPGDLSASQKIRRMKDYQEKYGRFDQPHGPYRIEIYHWREISRMPLSAGRAPAERR